MKKVKLYKIVWYSRVKGKPWKKEGIIKRGVLLSTAKKFVHSERKKMTVEEKKYWNYKIFFDKYKTIKGERRRKKTKLMAFFGW